MTIIQKEYINYNYINKNKNIFISYNNMIVLSFIDNANRKLFEIDS